jgi:hypothetical protein
MQTRQSRSKQRRKQVPIYLPFPFPFPFLPSRRTLQCGVAKGHRIPYQEVLMSSLALPQRVRGFGGRTRGGAPTSSRGRADLLPLPTSSERLGRESSCTR